MRAIVRYKIVMRYASLLSVFFILQSYSVFGQDSSGLAWDECLAYAQKYNPDLISAREVIKQSEASKGIVQSSGLPSISAGASYAHSSTEGVLKDSYGYDLSASQLLFDGFKTINNINSSRAAIQSAKHQYNFSSSKVRLNLRSAFIALLKAQEMLKVTQEIFDLRNDEVNLINLRYESGLEHRGALLTSQANLAQANFELAQAKRNIRFSQRQLAVRIGWGDFKALIVRGEFVSNVDISEPDFDSLVKSNPQYLAAIAKRNIAEYDLKATYGSLAPEVTAHSRLGRSGDSWPPSNDAWSVGVGLQMPIFEGGLQQAQILKAKAGSLQALADMSSAYNLLVMNMEQYWAAMCDALDSVKVKEKSLDAANERYEIAKAQYSTGFINFDSWIIIENDLVSAKKGYLDARANALYAQANWEYTKGGVLEYAN